ncbi:MULTISPECIES: Rrf2 family transcriptional regulator [Dyadobacter]|jgi:Rrf2 family protein|uniref:Rrf2 family transcriptional regulator n=1 Tax=Dyadobacter chenhuakuii TaxID=2909339 RepID=A0A9X1QGM6_9BACT|nr:MULTISPECIES: Rrf2 family transcriptional regulator [Dyadobacter]MCE7073511.1 Rrf2 family transcriptional regulator [Dyadobacter sp. CY327]MCF2495935.1 Rrf2 family transcriptional regulator [Dyadobacter chenhuakuii]MCF2499384.1 Rrf2 family transcriptional regulator [Dyadobacter chenhuakuii]MCF2519887.1 Rrf2 family transcriptional regulator [Dyadobacter sp. CY351]USJ30006.1 Rrf2 family transcriptional regulator [Dyadobacter chenhuakuii]
MISKKAKYALKALKVLAEQYGKGPVLISYIAEKEKIPKKFLEAILLDLRNNGVLQSQKGKGGGYLLRIPPGEVNFSKVLRIIDGPIAPALCVSMFFYGRCDDCKDEETCSLRSVLERWRDANLAVLDQTTLNDLLQAENAQPTDVLTQL